MDSTQKVVSVLVCGAVLAGWPLASQAQKVRGPIKYQKIVAVVVGLGSYQHPAGWPRLTNAEHDADGFARLMLRFGAEVVLLKGAQATRRRIINSLDDAAERLRSRRGDRANLLVFYFAGHGVTRSTDGSGGYLVPYDGERNRTADWLPMSTLKQKSAEYSHVKHMLFVLGSCFSGTLMRSQSSPLSNVELRSRYLAHHWIADGLRKTSRVAITAGKADQRIPDGVAGQGSEFGNSVVDAFAGGGGARFAAADLNRDYCVSTDEWFAHISAHGRTAHNTPFFGRLAGDRQGSVVLCRRWPVPGADDPRLGGPVPGADNPRPAEQDTADPTGASEGPLAEDTGERTKKVLAYTLFGVAGAGLVTMGALYAVGLPRKNEAQDDLAAAASADKPRYQEEMDDANRLVVAGYVMAGVSVAAAGIGLWAWLTVPKKQAGAPDKNKAASALHLAPSAAIGPQGAVLTVGGVF